MEQPDDRLRGPRVRGDRRGRHDGRGRDVPVRQRPGGVEAGPPDRRHHQHPANRGGGGRAPHRPRVRHVLRAARRGRQRDDPEPDLPRDARPAGEPRPARTAPRRPVAAPGGGRRDAAVRVAGDVHAPHRAERCGPARTDDQEGRQGRALVHRGQPRPRRLRRSAPVRHPTVAERLPGLRRRRPALLPGVAPGQARDHGHVRGAPRPALHIELAGPVERLRSNFINGIKHMPLRVSTSG